ncbi:hypothetical protein A2U01_0089076, partial [Trifolium medium]|nr:hypothetical protein [Trifolium medium]
MASLRSTWANFGKFLHSSASLPYACSLAPRLCLEGTYCLCLLRAAPDGLRL